MFNTAYLQFFLLLKILFGTLKGPLELKIAWYVLDRAFFMKRRLTYLILILFDLLKNLFYPLGSNILIKLLLLFAD
jgi:hypothetical protein